MAIFLTDALPMDEWLRRRKQQLDASPLDDLDPASVPRLGDGMPMADWQKARDLQASGVLAGGEFDDSLSGGAGDDRLAPAAGPAARPAKPAAPAELADLPKGLGENAFADGPLLGLISGHEGGPGLAGYDATYGFGKYAPPGSKAVTEMTVGEVKALQQAMLRRGSPSTAIGKYQFLANTLPGLQKTLGVPDSAVMSPALQDAMVRPLLGSVGYQRFLADKKTEAEFQRKLAGRFRSLAAGPDDLAYRSNLARPGVRAQVPSSAVRDALARTKAAATRASVLEQQLDGGYLPPRY